ncbi:SWEET sugar transporter [Arabidopsis thaliana x Arabidopsis arenosa]|uniref:SWEET sugar transporter n=1 Tax=Arabidopsis thaliana x Arabidopsis arenosa TaxID=1240361 RepID=A0A8T2ARI5_9BRAS|nr:SWEET sugar transporter [Arabidopsis thaliana x Arabidopsis arenosa]
MMNVKDIRIIIGIIGNVLSTLISLSHMPEYIQIYKKKSVEGVKPDRHILMLIQCSLWVLYGLPVVHKDSILVTTSNSIGFVNEVIYVVVFWICCEDESRKINVNLCLLAVFYFVTSFYVITIWAIESLFAKYTLIGIVCNIFNICIYVSFAKKKMLESKTFKYMPFWLSLVSFINAGLWTAYSLIYKIDIYVLICSGLETLFCAFQLIVHACSYKPHQVGVIV